MGSKRSIGHFEFVRGTGSVFRGTALWDCFGDAVASFIGNYKVAREQGTTPTQATVQPQND